MSIKISDPVVIRPCFPFKCNTAIDIMMNDVVIACCIHTQNEWVSLNNNHHYCVNIKAHQNSEGKDR